MFIGEGEPALALRQPLFFAQGHIVALEKAVDPLAVLLQNLDDEREEHILDLLHAERQRLRDEQVFKPVDRQAGEGVCLAEDQAAAGGIHGGFAVFPGIADTHLDECVIYNGIFFAGHHADGDLGTGVDKALSHRVAVKVRNENHITVFELSLNFVNLVIIDPGTAGLQGAAFAFF